MSAQPSRDRDLIGQLPPALQYWLKLERFHLHKPAMFQNRTLDPSFDPQYFPQNGGAFALPCFWVRRQHLQVYGRQRADELRLFAGDRWDDRVLFPIHPSSLPHYESFLARTGAEDAALAGLRVWAVPTSSTRTLLAWPDAAPEQALCIKTSLHSPILGDRHLYAKSIGRSVGLSALLQESRDSLPAALGCLPEAVGFVPRSLPDGGALARSIPAEVKSGRLLLAPLFALFGGTENHVPLFLTLVERTGMSARQLLEEVLCAPFTRLWVDMSLRLGLILEAHGQDLMLALAPDFTPLQRFYYKDFEGLQVDWALRRSRGLAAPADMPHAWRWRETYDTWGYPYSELIWYKLRISLLQFFYLVLNELEQCLRQWHECGLLRDAAFETGEVAMIFSRHMFGALDDLFGMRAVPYDISRHLNRFVISLLRLRREIMH